MMKKKVSSIYKRPTRFTPVGESRTKQSFKDETDINQIVKRYTKGIGIDPNSMQELPLEEKNFGDFSDVPDLRGLYERMHRAEESFSMLPSKVRLKFENDPLAFMEFASEPSNIEEMRELGLAPYVEKAKQEDQATPAGGQEA